MNPVNPVEALRRAGGAARRNRLPGVSRRRLTASVRRGEVLSPAPGLYQLPGCEADVLAAAAVDGVLSCGSAARDWGLPVIGTPAPHATTRRGGTRTWRRTVVHRRTVEHDTFRTTLLRTVLDCLRCLDLHEAVGIADHALHHDLLSPRDLELAAEGLHPSDPLRTRIALVDGRAMSPPESWARVFLVQAGFSVDIQVEIDEVGWIDIIVDGWLIIEIDGEEYHRGAGAFANDRRRDRKAYPRGCVVIRFPAVEVLRQEQFLTEVRSVHAAGRPRR